MPVVELAPLVLLAVYLNVEVVLLMDCLVMTELLVTVNA